MNHSPQFNFGVNDLRGGPRASSLIKGPDLYACELFDAMMGSLATPRRRRKDVELGPKAMANLAQRQLFERSRISADHGFRFFRWHGVVVGRAPHPSLNVVHVRIAFRGESDELIVFTNEWKGHPAFHAKTHSQLKNDPCTLSVGDRVRVSGSLPHSSDGLLLDVSCTPALSVFYPTYVALFRDIEPEFTASCLY
jgi:hypothetical protein